MSRHQDLNDPGSLRSRLRKRRVRHLVRLVAAVIQKEKKETVTIADIGGSYRYWKSFPFDRFPGTRFEITLINISAARFYEKAEYPNAAFVALEGDACDLHTVENDRFDISHSNSVIEHVGGWDRIKKMRDEVLRTGRYYFVQTPNYWFPVEPHFLLPGIQFLPRPWYVRTLEVFRKNDFDRATANYDSHRMLTRREFAWLFPDARMITERFWGLAKSYIALSAVS